LGLTPCIFRRFEEHSLNCAITSIKVENNNHTHRTTPIVCSSCTIPEILSQVNCVNLVLEKTHQGLEILGQAIPNIIPHEFPAYCQAIVFQQNDTYETKCSPECPAYAAIHKDLSEEKISIPGFDAAEKTDRELRQDILTVLYKYHANHPERYEFFDITIEFLASSLNLQPSDILRVIKPMEDEKELVTSEQSRYVRITSKGIRMIDEEPLFALNTAGVRVMGDQYNISGQAGAVGPGAKAEANTFNQIPINQDIDMRALAKELEQLSEYLAADARDPEKEEDIATVVLAKKAAQRGDKGKALELLSSGGKWMIDAATQVGASLVAAIIQKQMGL
jgi:hypothetical protein